MLGEDLFISHKLAHSSRQQVEELEKQQTATAAAAGRQPAGAVLAQCP
jgi:hypothetical protein